MSASSSSRLGLASVVAAAGLLAGGVLLQARKKAGSRKKKAPEAGKAGAAASASAASGASSSAASAAAEAEAKGAAGDTTPVPENSVRVTCSAPVNIAVIKYWGKRDTTLILPSNSSLSGTIDPGTMQSRTTITASRSYESDYMTLNGKVVDLAGDKRLQAVVKALQAQAGDLVEETADGEKKVLVAANDWPSYRLRVVSYNNFPTAAGLASSASGLACFTRCLAEVYSVPTKTAADLVELTKVARQGSGSACRSLHGGFVAWRRGVRADGEDSMAEQIVDETHWPQMRVLILVVNSGPKETPSTAGMQMTVKTSPLLKQRCRNVVPARMEEMERSIRARDFASFARLTMADSNQFHAVCLDTTPPIFYLNETSRRIIEMVERMNEAAGEPIVAYTFDAGPNAVLYLLEENLEIVFKTCMQYFLPSPQIAPVSAGDASGAQKRTTTKRIGEGEAEAARDVLEEKQKDEAVAAFVTDPLKLAVKAMPFRLLPEKQRESDEGRRRFMHVLGKRNSSYNVSRIIVSKVGEGAKIMKKEATF